MHDWNELVRMKLADLKMKPEEKEEVIEELAAHLEETFETLQATGMSEQKAIRQALSEVPDWKVLTKKIYLAKRKGLQMNNRVKRFWLPGLLTFLVSMSLLAAIEKFAPRLWPAHLSAGTAVIRTMPSLPVYIPWLIFLPFIGGMGAYLSSRAGGSVRTVLLSSLFPILPPLAVFAILLPSGFLIDRLVMVNVVTAIFLQGLVEWVLIPGTILLVGGRFAEFIVLRRTISRRPQIAKQRINLLKEYPALHGGRHSNQNSRIVHAQPDRLRRF
jgi:hypothetical protein